MNVSVVRFPVTCPACSRESLARLSVDTVLQSLATDRPFKLYAKCDRHAIAWVANEAERNQIREYTDAVNVSAWGGNARARARAGPLLRIV
jgi:hypothetical protein